MLCAERHEKSHDIWVKEQSKYITVLNPKNAEWRCPLCKQKVIHVSEGTDGTVPHFRHKKEAEHPRISEGETHNIGKTKILEKLKKDNNLKESELEKVIGNFEENDYQIADIYIKTSDNEKVAVELQISSQSVQNFKKRTRFYNKKNISVLWILGKKEYAYQKTTSAAPSSNTLVFKDSVKWIQKNWYGRTYILENLNPLNIQPYRLERKKVRRTSSHPDYPSRTEYLQTVADFSKGELDNYGIFSTDSGDLEIARFYDKCWWK